MSATEVIELQPVQSVSSRHHPPSKSSFEYSNAAHPIDDAVTNPLDDEQSLHASNSKQSSTLRIVLTIFQPSFVNFLSSFTNGIITVGLPVIAREIDLPRSLYLWPSSVYGLTAGALLLIAGSIADIIGARLVEIVGVLLMAVFTLACGFANTGIQLVVFRAFQGISMAMHLPASVAMIASAVPSGRARNIGFGCLGLSQPLGFSVGLVASGIMIERASWRLGFYLSGGAMIAVCIAIPWLQPKAKPHPGATLVEISKKLYNEIDWVGGVIASGGLAILAYVLAILSADLTTIRSATMASLLAVSLVLLIAFPFWMRYRERAGKSALVPNSLWKNMPFTSTCIMVTLAYGALNAIELFSSLYFQEVQKVSVLTTSLYLLPNMVVGIALNFCVGVFVDRLPARWLITISSMICAASPLMMALVNPDWSYWYLEFWAQAFAPMCVDVLFTVGLIIVSDNFPEKTQALAGAVFNTVSQFGTSLGMGVCQVVALSVMGKAGEDQNSDQGDAFEDANTKAVLEGYRASFWTMFAYMVACGLIALVGLRKAGKVGLKRE